MSSRWTGFLVWALVAVSTAFWGMRLFAATRPLPASAQAPGAPVPRSGPMERLFGAIVVPAEKTDAPPPESSRFQLVGVIAPPAGGGGEGVAIVSVDNQPARPWHVGATLDGNTTLLSVAKRTADFGPPGGPAAFTLTLPEPAAAATGTLPAATVVQAQPVQPAPPQFQPPAQQAPQPMGSPEVENAQHVAQPGIPGMPTRRGLRGRELPQAVPSNAVPPGRTAPLPGAAPVVQQDGQDGQPQQQ